MDLELGSLDGNFDKITDYVNSWHYIITSHTTLHTAYDTAPHLTREKRKNNPFQEE